MSDSRLEQLQKQPFPEGYVHFAHGVTLFAQGVIYF